jgi:hypothetical protein
MSHVIHSAPHLYALARSRDCQGNQRCHWCGGPCERTWLHDDPPPIPFERSKSSARVVCSPYVCPGCWLFRVRRTTVWFLAGGYRDGQNPCQHSWLVTPTHAHALRDEDRERLLQVLLDPPLTFCLSLIDKEVSENLLHLCPVNRHATLRADTELHFNFNGVTHSYLVYELEDVVKRGKPNGKSAGVRLLHDYLQPPVSLALADNKRRKQGRPDGAVAAAPQRLIRESGYRMSG